MYLALGIPVLLMFLFGFALSLDVDNIPIAVWNQDGSPYRATSWIVSRVFRLFHADVQSEFQRADGEVHRQQ